MEAKEEAEAEAEWEAETKKINAMTGFTDVSLQPQGIGMKAFDCCLPEIRLPDLTRTTKATTMSFRKALRSVLVSRKRRVTLLRLPNGLEPRRHNQKPSPRRITLLLGKMMDRQGMRRQLKRLSRMKRHLKLLHLLSRRKAALSRSRKRKLLKRSKPPKHLPGTQWQSTLRHRRRKGVLLRPRKMKWLRNPPQLLVSAGLAATKRLDNTCTMRILLSCVVSGGVESLCYCVL